jgi:HlyD family secretion protein
VSTRTRVVSAVLVLALLVLAVAAFRAFRPAAVPVARVTRQPLAQTLVVSGRVMPPIRVTIGSLLTGVVRRRFVEDGQRVKAGDLLVQIDDVEWQASVGQARAAVAQAAVKLEQIHRVALPLVSESLTQARLTYDRAEKERQRVQALGESGIVASSAVEDAVKAAEMARSQLQAISVQQAGSGPAGVDERSAQALLDQTRAALAAAETKLAQTAIRAPGDGLIISRSVEAGDIVQPGKALLVLAVDGPTLLTIDPDERNLGGIWMGQSASAAADAYPSLSFAATVSFIGAAVNPDRGTVEVRLTVPSPPPTLRPDMTVSVELQGTKRTDALVVPVECVRDAAGRAPWALVVADGRVERRAVRVGVRGDALIEITGGLREGEAVIPASAGSPEPGTRLSAQPAGR